mgnify:CR=1 FL=1
MDRRILIVDDNVCDCQQLAQWLTRPDRRVKMVHEGTSALECLIEGQFSLALVDLQLPGIGGIEIVDAVRKKGLTTTVIMVTGHASIDSAVEAMKLGAYDYITKPIDPLQLDLLVEQALKDHLLQDEVAQLREGLRQRFGFHNLVGRSPRMREIFDQVARVASKPCTVLIVGETGTGKELVAQALHQADATRTGSLVTVNCAALPETLLESELFGHERGAFTGADRQKKGRFELAHGGTLFLDEIGELPIAMQAKLLRVLQDGTYERVGGTETLRTDVRILAATNLDLADAVARGRFREDLFYRLNVVSVDLPPLRERIEDLPLLASHVLSKLEAKGWPRKDLSRATLAILARHEWPGNVRELENLLEQLVLTTSGPLIEPEHLPSQVEPTREAPFTLDIDTERPLAEITAELIERIERAYLHKVLEHHEGRIERCAAQCGLSRRSISEKLRRYGIDKADYKPHVRARRSLAGAES